MNFNQKNLQIISVIILAIAIKVYIDHRTVGYKGPYRPSGAYDNITAVKHDVTKSFSVDLFIMLALGMSVGEKFYDSNNMLNSWLGKAMVTATSYFVYHELVQPYVANALPNW
jgi:hypothetical protein